MSFFLILQNSTSRWRCGGEGITFPERLALEFVHSLNGYQLSWIYSPLVLLFLTMESEWETQLPFESYFITNRLVRPLPSNPRVKVTSRKVASKNSDGSKLLYRLVYIGNFRR